MPTRHGQPATDDLDAKTQTDDPCLLLQRLPVRLLPRQIFGPQGLRLSRKNGTRAACCALITATLVTGCGQSQDDQGPAAPPQVGVVSARAAPVPLTRDLVGRLSATRVADVRARVPG